MRNIFKWLLVFDLGLLFVGCGGSSGSAIKDSKNAAKIVLKDNKTYLIEESDTHNIISKSIDDTNKTLKVIVVNNTLSKKITSTKNIVTIAPNKQFPLGYTGKIVKKVKDPNGNEKFVLKDVDISDIKEINMPKTDVDISQLNFVGIITPQEARNAIQSKSRAVVIDKQFPIHFDGKDINLQSSDNSNYKYYLNEDKKAWLEIAGKISNIKISNKGEFKVDVANLKNDGVKKIANIDFWDHMNLKFDVNFEAAIKGRYTKSLVVPNEIWDDLSKVAFEKFGISLKGLTDLDKKGKIPIGGLVYNGVVKPGIGTPNVTVAKEFGLILWVYADLSGSLYMDGSLGISSNYHQEINFLKEKNKATPTITNTVKALPNKKYFEAPFLQGSFDAKITNGLSVEADLLVGGLRVVNVSGEAKMELSGKLSTKDRLSYGLDKPGDKWKWNDGEICYDANFGVGLLAKVNLFAGLKYEGKLGELNTDIMLNYQYPSLNDIKNLQVNPGEYRRVGSWYKIQIAKGCKKIPSPATLEANHVINKRQAVNQEQAKDISDQYYKYAYLANRIYTDKFKNIDSNNWKLIDLTYNSTSGFKAGLYKNTKTNEYIISYGGTTAEATYNSILKTRDSILDLITDLTMLGLVTSSQPTEALTYYEKAKKIAGGNINGITGHSLGGGLAQYAGLYSGVKTITFNTAPLPFNTLKSLLFFKDKVKRTENDGLLQSVVFDNENKITNIMAPHDPISMISTAIMSISEGDIDYLMAAKFFLAISPIQKLDYLITGDKIYLPIENQGGFANFSNHSMDLLEGFMKKNTNYSADFDVMIDGGLVYINTINLKHKSSDNLPYTGYVWFVIDKNGNEIKSGDQKDPIENLPKGDYKLKVVLLLDDGREVESIKDISIIGIDTTQNNLTLELLNNTECKSSGFCRFKIGIPKYNNNYHADLSFGDGEGSTSISAGLGGNFPSGEENPSDNNYTYSEHNKTYANHGKYTVTLSGDVDGVSLDSVSLDVVIDGTIQTSSKLKKTGQTKSYDQNGNEVTDGSIKDDGYYQKGLTPSYTRDDAKEVVTDNITGLMWQDDEEAKTIKKHWITQANWDVGNYNDTSGDTATTYCQNLTLGGYDDWRLPTEKELESIIYYGRIFPSIDTNYFKNVSSNRYWSSTTFLSADTVAWLVSFDYGNIHGFNNKIDSGFVRCVRSIGN